VIDHVNGGVEISRPAGNNTGTKASRPIQMGPVVPQRLTPIKCQRSSGGRTAPVEDHECLIDGGAETVCSGGGLWEVMTIMIKFQFLLRALAALVLAAALALHSGCLAVAAGAAGAGTVAYVRGELAATLDQNIDRTERAANRAIADLKFAKISETQDALVAVIVARTAEDKKIEIRVSSLSAAQAKVQIRVGVFGDEALAQRILENIRANL